MLIVEVSVLTEPIEHWAQVWLQMCFLAHCLCVISKFLLKSGPHHILRTLVPRQDH